jgi:hypothetical protein
MPRTPRSSVRRTSSSTATRAVPPEPRLAQLEEEADHERTASSQHKQLVREKLDNLRSLIDEVKQDDWKYDSKDRLPNHVTKSLAWGAAGAPAATDKL